METKDDSNKVWFRKKIANNNTKYTLNGVTSKSNVSYFPLEGAENQRFPNADCLAKYLTKAKKDTTKSVYYGYDEKLGIGIKEEKLKQVNPESTTLPTLGEEDPDNKERLGVYTYHIDTSTGEEGFIPMSTRSDKYIDVDGALAGTEKSIKRFIERRDWYRENNIIYKLGVMMYGPPGEGKSSLIRHLINQCLPKDCVVFYVHGLPTQAFLMKVDKSLGSTLKVFVFEEFTEVEEKLARNGQTDKLLQFLDGEYSLNNSIILATTNFPEKLPANIVNRPGRFDKLIFFDHPNETTIKKILSEFLHRDYDSISRQEVEAVKGLSIAAIKEVCLMMSIEDIDFIDAAKVLQTRKQICNDRFKKSQKSGFGI